MNSPPRVKTHAPIISPGENDSPKLVEVTTYIREDRACALEMIQIAEQQLRRIPCDQAELFQEALDLLIKARLIPIRVLSGTEPGGEKTLSSSEDA